MKTGTATLPLHGGKCPAWLFEHMKNLIQAIMEVIIQDQGPEEILHRLSDPYWFQALGCVAGFDWHSSGLTTTVCGALKEGLRAIGPSAGLFCAGGKGRTSRNTPAEIRTYADLHPLTVNPDQLVYASRLSAKIDNAAVQDGFQIYHHCFFFTAKGQWAVVQQGMNQTWREARRYHWLSSRMETFTREPQAAICGDRIRSTVNLVSKENQSLQKMTVDLACQAPEAIIREVLQCQNHIRSLRLPGRHSIPATERLNKQLHTAYERQPQHFADLIELSGIGPSTLRALSLVAEIAYGVKPSLEDPVRYSFAHGGKDGYPFPVNQADIQLSCETLRQALTKAKQGHYEKLHALRKLARWHSEMVSVKAMPYLEEQPRHLIVAPTSYQPSLFS